MKLLTRYVLREFCVPLFYCLTGFVSIYLLFELFGSFSRLSAARPGWGKACAYLAGYLAPYVMWMAPACLMLATLYTMWNFCRHSELVAMRANGIGFFTIVKPLLAVATLMALFVGWVNEVYVPRYGQWAKLYKAHRFKEEDMDKADDIVFHNAAKSRTWRVGLLVNEEASILEDVSVSVRRVYPNALFFEPFDRFRDVRDFRYLHEFACARRRFENGRGQSAAAALRDNYPVNAATFGGSDNRPEISRIGHTVENDDEGFLALFFRIVENSVGIAILVICRKRNDALMVRGPRYAFKFVSVRFDDGNAPVSRFRDNFDDRAFAFSVSNIQFVNGSSASQQFGNGISSRDDIFTVNAVFRLKDGTRSVLRRFSLNGLFSAAV